MFKIGKYHAAIEEYRRVVEVSQAKDKFDVKTLKTVLPKIALLSCIMKYWDEAIEYYVQLLGLYKSNNDWDSANSLIWLGKSYLNKRMFKECVFVLQDGQEIIDARPSSDLDHQLDSILTCGQAFYGLEDYKDALDICDFGLNIIEKKNRTDTLVWHDLILRLQANSLRKLGGAKVAKKHLCLNVHISG